MSFINKLLVGIGQFIGAFFTIDYLQDMTGLNNEEATIFGMAMANRQRSNSGRSSENTSYDHDEEDWYDDDQDYSEPLGRDDNGW